MFCGLLSHITVTQTVSRDTTVTELSMGSTKLSLTLTLVRVWLPEFSFAQTAITLALNPILHGVSVIANTVSALTVHPAL